MAKVHFVCGPVASGKSTYSAKLAARDNAIVLSMDKWMQTLFGADIPKSDGMSGVDFAWFAERVDRCEVQMWDTATQLLKKGSDVVLDWGFIRRERREKATSTAVQLGQEWQWHVVHADLEIRRARVLDRNTNQGETFAFTVTPAMFEFSEHIFEAPDAIELPMAIRVTP
jgi:predicted kinase